MNKGLRWCGLVGLLLFILSCDAGSEHKPVPPPLEPALVQRGARIYASLCASCHGPNGEGAPGWHTPDERGELPAPPHNADGHTWRHADAMLYQMVRDGWRDRFNRTERLTMPAFGEMLSPLEIQAVITYLKTWWLPEQRRFQWQESRKNPFPSDTVPERP